jgi:hypothetical protein
VPCASLSPLVKVLAVRVNDHVLHNAYLATQVGRNRRHPRRKVLFGRRYNQPALLEQEEQEYYPETFVFPDNQDIEEVQYRASDRM